MKRILEGLLSISILIVLLGIVFYFKTDLANVYFALFNKGPNISELEYSNDYTRDYNYTYVSSINKFDIKSKQDILNAYYSIINSGIDKFTFYCSKDYENCISELKEIANNQNILSNINSFVHPYNSFSKIDTSYEKSLGKITLTIKKSYTEEEIDAINTKVDAIIDKKLKKVTDQKEIIKIIHDYIINNSKYDSDRSDRNIIQYKSHIAYGPLIQKYGICGGYTDAMAIFLDRYNIPNFKVISENHIWNAVYLDGEWYHLDLTWDDPVVSDGSNALEYNIFLITTKELQKLDTTQHVYDKEVFKEVK